MIIDIVNKGDVTTGRSIELKPAARGGGQGYDQRGRAQFYEGFTRPTSTHRCRGTGPARHGHRTRPRDVLWVGILGGTLAKINTRSMEDPRSFRCPAPA